MDSCDGFLRGVAELQAWFWYYPSSLELHQVHISAMSPEEALTNRQAVKIVVRGYRLHTLGLAAARKTLPVQCAAGMQPLWEACLCKFLDLSLYMPGRSLWQHSPCRCGLQAETETA